MEGFRPLGSSAWTSDDEQGRIWIIELNGKPMKSMFSALGDARLMKTVYERPLCYALHLCSPQLIKGFRFV